MGITRTPRLLFRLGCGALVLLAVAGCGDATGEVGGVVTVDGKPVHNARVTFLCQGESNRNCTSITPPNAGSYKIINCPVGPVQITVESLHPRPKSNVAPARAAKEVDALQERMRKAKGGWTPKATAVVSEDNYTAIPDRYRDPSRSGLNFTVNRGAQEYNLELTSK